MKILFGWVPAHVGLMVNEELDRNAEQALQGVAGGQRSGEYTGREQAAGHSSQQSTFF